MTLKRAFLPIVLTIIAVGLFFFFKNVNNRVYLVEGQIIGFSENENRIFINHEEIPGYMEAMSMPFNLRDMLEVSDFSIGDAVRFEFHVTPEGSWIQNIIAIPDSLLTLSAIPSRFGKMSGGELTVPLVEGEQIPSFSMVDQEGRSFTSDSLIGYHTVLTFIYTTCPVPDFCPLMSSNLDKLSTRLTDDELRMVKLVSVTFDPQHDTPEVLAAYAGEHEQRGNRFYLMGDSANTKILTSSFGIFTTFAGDQIVHNLQTAIIGPKGEIVSLYSGNKWGVEDLLADLRNRLNSVSS